MDSYKCISKDFASCLIAKANDKKLRINMTKLQKLLYVAYGVYLAVKDQILFDEKPQAWPYGPVFPLARKAFLNVEDFNNGSIKCSEDLKNNTEIQSLIDAVLSTYGPLTAGQLTDWSHKEGSPWALTVGKDPSKFIWGQIIPDSYISQYFKDNVMKNG